jgi:hypothetical protein
MFTGVARTTSAEAPEIVPSAHCVARFRQRLPLPRPGVDAAVDGLLAVLEDADVMTWPPAWAVSDRPAELWAVASSGDLAFPLARGNAPGRWVAVTCLARADGGRWR